MKKVRFTVICAVGLLMVALQATQLLAQGDSEVQAGLNMSPVLLNTRGLNVALVGKGSYLINGPGNCTGCHTVGARFLPGGNPFLGQAQLDNAVNFLGGGRIFNFNTSSLIVPPVPPTNVQILSRNLTPDAQGRPGGLTLAQFELVLRTGADFKLPLVPPAPWPTPQILQIMPWFEYARLTDNDIRAMYEYLKAIPCLEGGPAVPADRCVP